MPGTDYVRQLLDDIPIGVGYLHSDFNFIKN